MFSFAQEMASREATAASVNNAYFFITILLLEYIWHGCKTGIERVGSISLITGIVQDAVGRIERYRQYFRR